MLRSAAIASLILILCGLIGCSSTPEEQALEDIRDTTIIPNLGSYDDGVQKEAVARMLNILETAPDVGANLLVASLRDPVHEDRTKMVCAWLLSTVRDRRALPYLMTYLGQGSNTGESLVREAVSAYGASVLPSVTEVLEEGGDLARIAAAEVIFELGTREAVDALVSRLDREPEARVRFLILCGIASERPPRIAVARHQTGSEGRGPEPVAGPTEADADLGGVHAGVEPAYEYVHVGADRVGQRERSAEGHLVVRPRRVVVGRPSVDRETRTDDHATQIGFGPVGVLAGAE